MTFENSGYAINGALTSAADARQALYASLNGAEGVVLPGDLKVTQLSTPGVGIQIAGGVGLLLNKYLAAPNETYTAPNTGVHIVPSSSMPASNPSAKSYIVAVVLGDPDFSQAGHPWMPAEVPDGQETTFQYVRPTLIEVPAGSTSIPNQTYPALALARIDVPANTTTITNAMITDLRALARPRSVRIPVRAVGPASESLLNGSGALWQWPTQASWNLPVPKWATQIIAWGGIEGLRVPKAGSGLLGIRLGASTAMGNTNIVETGAGVKGYQIQGIASIPESMRGTTQAFQMIGATASAASNGFLGVASTATAMFVVEFTETVA